ncbi:MAG TPA: GH3 auxin-responsive promoter family protein [Lacunisphaera sp.]|nr:GH3 auxin-responsive promoter family protein [Lacunisphaera sp.]
MTLAPRFLVALWARMRVARFARRLKVPGAAVRAQQDTFARLMAAAAPTAHGRALGFSPSLTYAEFRDRVPLQTYATLEPLVARMAAGEANVLVPGVCRLFVESAGSFGPQPKLLPVPDAMLAHFQHGLQEAVFHYAHRCGHKRLFLGRHLHVGASTALVGSPPANRTSFDGILARCLSPWVAANLHSPSPALAGMPEGAEKIDALASAAPHHEITLVGGTPAELCALAQAVREGAASGPRPAAQLQALWPRLECCLYTGAPLGIFAEPLRAALGPGVNLHEVYAAAEGIFAAQDGEKPPGLRLLADAGIFYEFLPLASYHEATVERAVSQCIPLAKIMTGTDYVPVVTTPAGLCRYVTGDIVRFVSIDPPRLIVVGRAAARLDALNERDVTETLQAVCTRNAWQPIAFHVAPYEQRQAPGQVSLAHEWWLELRTHSMKTPTANVIGPELDAELCRRHAVYAARRAENVLGPPQIRLVMPGVFDRWAREQRKTASASKLPRCRPDRQIADQLAALAPFHQPTLVPTKNSRAPV